MFTYLRTKLLSPVVAVLTLGLLLTLPSVSQAVQIKIDNYSNEKVFVAIAYNQYKGNTKLFVEGWFAIDKGQSQTWNFDNADDVYLRVQRSSNAAEINWNDYRTYLFFPVIGNAFTASATADDNNVRILSSGGNNSYVNRNAPLPNGWVSRRFFKVGTNNRTLEIRPF